MVSRDSTTQTSEGFSSDESHMTFHSPSPTSCQATVTQSSSESKSESESVTSSLPKTQRQQQQKKDKKKRKKQQEEEEEENDGFSKPSTKNKTFQAAHQGSPAKENKIMKAEALERKWHNLHILELEAFSARLDLLQEVCKIWLEELKKPVSRGRY